MRKVFFTAVLMLITAMPVLAQDPIITTGGQKGTYFKVGHNIKRAIGGEVVNSAGGEENINRLLKGEAQIGFTQLDTLAYMSSKNGDVSNSIEILGPLYKEAVYVVGNCKGRVQDEDDLQKEGVTIAIGKAGSGGASTWDYMRTLEPGYKKAAVSYTGGIRALGKLAAQTDGDIDAVLFVTKPVMEGEIIATVMKNENLCFIDIDDKDLNDKYEATGKPVYDFCDISVQKGVFSNKKVSTICMDAVIIAGASADESYLENLSSLILNYKATLLK